jgi:hypothetical protein
MNQSLNNYIGLHQNNETRCEMVVGSHVDYFSEIFNRNTEDKEIKAETEWMNRMKKYDKDKILVCPIFKIEETAQGSNYNKHTELFDITNL